MNVRSMNDDERNFRLSNDNMATAVSVSADLQSGSSLDSLRNEALRIIGAARKEVAELRAQTSAFLEVERSSLTERAKGLESARKQLEVDANLIEKRSSELRENVYEEARKEGFEKGYRSGHEEGLRQGKEEAYARIEERVKEETTLRVQEELEVVLSPLRKLIQEMKGTRQTLLKNWEENILQISVAIAYQTIMREPKLFREAPLDLLREALDLAMNCATLKIRMNPRDISNLNDAIRGILEETGTLAKAEVVSDPKISLGGCLIETELGVVDERLESRLERIVAELSE